MAIVQVQKGSCGTVLDLYSEILYVARYEDCIPNYVMGFNVTPYGVMEEMARVKMVYGNSIGRQFYHLVISLEPGEKCQENSNALKLAGHLIGMYLADNQCLGRTQVLLALHQNTGKDHFHAVINNVDLNTKRRIDLDKRALYTLKQDISQILQCCGYAAVLYYQGASAA